MMAKYALSLRLSGAAAAIPEVETCWMSGEGRSIDEVLNGAGKHGFHTGPMGQWSCSLCFSNASGWLHKLLESVTGPS